MVEVDLPTTRTQREEHGSTPPTRTVIDNTIKGEVQDAIKGAVMKSSEPLETREIGDIVASTLGEQATRSKIALHAERSKRTRRDSWKEHWIWERGMDLVEKLPTIIL